jgi:hypothetical protein
VKRAEGLAEVDSLLESLARVLHPSHFLLLNLKERYVQKTT